MKTKRITGFSVNRRIKARAKTKASKRRKEIAKAIATELFHDPWEGKLANRLELKHGIKPNELSGGGWCYNAVVVRLEQLLKKWKV